MDKLKSKINTENFKFFFPFVFSIFVFIFFQWNYFFDFYLAHDPSMYLSQSLGIKSCFINSAEISCYFDRFLNGNTKGTLFPIFGGLVATIFNLNYQWTRFLIIISAAAFLYYYLLRIIRLKYDWLEGSLIFVFVITLSGLYFTTIFYSRDIFWIFGFIASLYYLMKNEIQELTGTDRYFQFIFILIMLLVRPILTPITFLIPLAIYYWEDIDKRDLKFVGSLICLTLISFIFSFIDQRDGESNYRILLFVLRTTLFFIPLIYFQKKGELGRNFLFYLSMVIYCIYVTPFLYDMVDFFYVSIFLESAKETLGVFSGDFSLKNKILNTQYYLFILVICVVLDGFCKRNIKKTLIYFYFFVLMGIYYYVIPRTDLTRFMAPFCLILYISVFIQNDKFIKKNKWILGTLLILSILSVRIITLFPKMVPPEATKESSNFIKKLGGVITSNNAKIRVHDLYNQYEFKWLLELHGHNQNKLWEFKYTPLLEKPNLLNDISCLGVDYWIVGPVRKMKFLNLIQHDFEIKTEKNLYLLKECN
jgi:hypothetical protein